MSKKIVLLAVFSLGLACGLPLAVYGRQPSPKPKLIVFYSATCHRCEQIRSAVMPEIERQFKDTIDIGYLDIAEIENYKFLLALKQRYGVTMANRWPVFYCAGKFLSSEEPVRERLRDFLRLASRLPAAEEEPVPPVDLVSRFRNLEPLAVTGAGLIDGINPCAFTVIIFFISFLALQGYRRRELAVIGACFILAVFLTYILIGLGIFQFLYRLRGFWLASKIFNITVGAVSLALGALAVYDAWKFKRSGSTEGLLLQLPQLVKNRIHAVIGRYYRRDRSTDETQLKRPVSSLAVSALVTGFLVSLLEAVCTGQMYLPTIAFVLKTSTLKLQALAYLLLYNLMFILPLAAVFMLALTGVSSAEFAALIRRQMSTVKILMAVLFFTLGVFLIWKG